MKPAVGKNPNPLFNYIDPGESIIKGASKLLEISEKGYGYVIDFETEKGGKYVIMG
jgi:hypothetical protein